jgi:hypothetical protein
MRHHIEIRMTQNSIRLQRGATLSLRIYPGNLYSQLAFVYSSMFPKIGFLMEALRMLAKSKQYVVDLL